MTQRHALKTVADVKPLGPDATFQARLTREQLECLSRGAKGISLRFEAQEIVDALVTSGYAEKGVAGIITVTAEGQEYARTHAS